MSGFLEILDHSGRRTTEKVRFEGEFQITWSDGFRPEILSGEEEEEKKDEEEEENMYNGMDGG